MPIKDVFTNDWCEVKENTLIFQYGDSSIAIEAENGFRIKVQDSDILSISRRIADIFLKGAENYEVHHSKSI